MILELKLKLLSYYVIYSIIIWCIWSIMYTLMFGFVLGERLLCTLDCSGLFISCDSESDIAVYIQTELPANFGPKYGKHNYVHLL